MISLTFITATIGRDTLQRTVDSVKAVTGAKHIIVGDQGYDPSEFDEGKRCIAFPMDPAPHHESVCRNYAIQIADTNWVAFVDDDDTVSPYYLHCLEMMISRNRSADAVMFRQTCPVNRYSANPQMIVIPNEREILWGNVGVSYAVRTSVAQQFPFKRSRHEDLLNLVAMEAAGMNIAWSNDIVYFGWDMRP